MLELDSLFAEKGTTTVPNPEEPNNQPETPVAQEKRSVSGGGLANNIGHSGHNGKAPVLGKVCPPNQLQHKGFGELGTVGTVGTVHLQGGECETGNRAPGGGAARDEFALHPSAVILLIAYCRALKINPVEQAEAIISLGSLPTGEQVRIWHQACIQKGIEPWRVLTIEAPKEGIDCTFCAHLLTRQFKGDSGRREYQWGCDLGYLILETGRGSERIWIAPPECQSFDRWYPTNQR